MDNFVIHLWPSPRRYPHPAPVENIGYVPHKTGWVQQEFRSFNFSFILKGVGEYRMDGRQWRVQAPCVITQWPGVHVEYGPDREWEELYMVYHASLLPYFTKNAFARRERPVWYIRDPGPLLRKLTELREHLDDPGIWGRADEVDRICEAMVLESLIAQDRPSRDEKEKAILSIREYVRQHYTEPIDFDELALDFGFSPSSFRRRWAEMVDLPPGKYVTRLRMRRARRLLVETNQSVGEVAWSIGYEDPLYFSRKFRDEVGMTATEYRRRHSAPLSLQDPAV